MDLLFGVSGQLAVGAVEPGHWSVFSARRFVPFLFAPWFDGRLGTVEVPLASASAASTIVVSLSDEATESV